MSLRTPGVRRPVTVSALTIAASCALVLSGCGEQTPGGMPAEGQARAETAGAGDAGAAAAPGADGQGAVEPAESDADDPIVVKIGEDEFLTNMAIYRRYTDAKETPLALVAPAAPAEALDGGKKQDFVDGTVFWSPATGAQIVRGQILATYLDNGGPGGRLGWPVGDETADGPVIFSDFQHGQIRLEDGSITVVEHTG